MVDELWRIQHALVLRKMKEIGTKKGFDCHFAEAKYVIRQSYHDVSATRSNPMS